MSRIDACRSLCSAGRATFTTVPSMKAMLEPRIVTIKTQGPLHVRSALGAFRLDHCSQGDLITVNIDETPQATMGAYFAMGMFLFSPPGENNRGETLALAPSFTRRRSTILQPFFVEVKGT